jgi:hypothetical protein
MAGALPIIDFSLFPEQTGEELTRFWIQHIQRSFVILQNKYTAARQAAQAVGIIGTSEGAKKKKRTKKDHAKAGNNSSPNSPDNKSAKSPTTGGHHHSPKHDDKHDQEERHTAVRDRLLEGCLVFSLMHYHLATVLWLLGNRKEPRPE